MFKNISFALAAMILTASLSFAGGWDTKKGMDKLTISGEIVCIGCSMKKLDGMNAQCDLYAQHAMGFKAQDGTLWSIVDNEKGHDVIRAHTLLGGKKAAIAGWLYPLAHFIEIDSITVEGVSEAQIQNAGFSEDMILVERLKTRKVGQVPTMEHKHPESEGHKH